MKTKLLTVSCISSLSLAMLASCSDSTSDLYNPATPIAGVEGEGYSSADAGYIIASSDSETGSQTGTPASSATVAGSSAATTTVSSSSKGKPSGTSSSSGAMITPIGDSSSSIAPVVQSSSSTNSQQVSGNTSNTIITYAANGATVSNGGNCVTVEGGSVKISCGGEYDISGSYSGSDAQILVNTAKTDSSVYLNMRGLTLNNTADAPIYIQKASKAFVVAKNGTTNTLSDGSSRTKTYNYTNDNGEAKTDTTGACIYAKDDLTIKGEGTLIVNGNYNNGIHTSNDLKVKNGLITVKAKNNGL